MKLRIFQGNKDIVYRLLFFKIYIKEAQETGMTTNSVVGKEIGEHCLIKLLFTDEQVIIPIVKMTSIIFSEKLERNMKNEESVMDVSEATCE